ncbi:isoamylase early set domain-containing protein [Galbibacter sp. EGI 63066]|uniref:isoamylase early set domain-containing protein n=1 Tax=Galbibacter sp. EGI 63066 TaxID=2993559 RepID=UPI0022499F52|nr:isoamylase early set domain-containing protein [Galbibacter sp. EGI 63066]MCX2679446.1 isoamylase early set domain-containing protein [Galbibacter sp. EGI 63066]
MAIMKQYLKSRPVCKVTFTVPAKEANEVVVVGDFNNWNSKEACLKKLKNGNFKGTFEVPKDMTYEFRYIIDGTYTNEAEADAFKWNDYAGTENAVLYV